MIIYKKTLKTTKFPTQIYLMVTVHSVDEVRFHVDALENRLYHQIHHVLLLDGLATVVNYSLDVLHDLDDDDRLDHDRTDLDHHHHHVRLDTDDLHVTIDRDHDHAAISNGLDYTTMIDCCCILLDSIDENLDHDIDCHYLDVTNDHRDDSLSVNH